MTMFCIIFHIKKYLDFTTIWLLPNTKYTMRILKLVGYQYTKAQYQYTKIGLVYHQYTNAQYISILKWGVSILKYNIGILSILSVYFSILKYIIREVKHTVKHY